MFHIEDALTAMADGELEANDATWRQVDAAQRAACAACDLQLSPAPNSEAAAPQGRLLVVVHDERVAEDIARAASRRKFSISIAGNAGDALAMAMDSDFNGLVIDFDDASPEECRGLAASLREIQGGRPCPLVVIRAHAELRAARRRCPKSRRLIGAEANRRGQADGLARELGRAGQAGAPARAASWAGTRQRSNG